MPPPVLHKDPSGRLLVMVLAVVMSAFVVASAVAQQASTQVSSLAQTIAAASSPSIERLVRLRGLVFEVELRLSEYLRGGAGSGPQRQTFETVLDLLNEATTSYLSLTLLPGEEPYWAQTQGALIRFNYFARSTGDLLNAGDIGAAREELAGSVKSAGEQLVQASLRGIDFHAQKSRLLANRIGAARSRTLWIANVLSMICVALGIGGLLIVRRHSAKYRALVEAYGLFHKTRADELELFAGRVAHDIRNPLSTARLATELLLQRVDGELLQRVDGERFKDPIARVVRSLSRAEAITTGLLEFARSGALPDPGARTNPGEVLNDFVRGISFEAEQRRIQFELEPVPRVLVACSPGVYLSLVGNLIRNAIKYMGDAPTRRIVISLSVDASIVRTEIGDTGPGIAAENLASLFEPYFRVGRTQEGLGLGLATVKKLADAHQGSVGVRSEPGQGSTFWFTLPLAGLPWTLGSREQ